MSEIQTYPKFLAAIKKAIGNKTLSVAVPGRKQDMIAFTKEQGPKIWQSVDMVNVMSYDLTNRRDNVTGFASSVQGSLDTINNYLDIGLDPAKMNLGFPYYAKWFMTDPNSDCDTHPVGCEMVSLENPDGSDNGKSGSLTFEKSTMAAPPKDLKTSTNGNCGYDEGSKCPSGSCCSQYGNWYVYLLFYFPVFSFSALLFSSLILFVIFLILTSISGTGDDFCQAGCLSDYGTCKGISIIDSWRRAQQDGKTEIKAGGQYYWDSEVNIFWTWDTPALIGDKFKDIVNTKKLGGVMAWSLAEDSLNWEHVDAMQQGIQADTSS